MKKSLFTAVLLVSLASFAATSFASDTVVKGKVLPDEGSVVVAQEKPSTISSSKGPVDSVSEAIRLTIQSAIAADSPLFSITLPNKEKYIEEFHRQLSDTEWKVSSIVPSEGNYTLTFICVR